MSWECNRGTFLSCVLWGSVGVYGPLRRSRLQRPTSLCVAAEEDEEGEEEEEVRLHV